MSSGTNQRTNKDLLAHVFELPVRVPLRLPLLLLMLKGGGRWALGSVHAVCLLSAAADARLSALSPHNILRAEVFCAVDFPGLDQQCSMSMSKVHEHERKTKMTRSEASIGE